MDNCAVRKQVHPEVMFGGSAHSEKSYRDGVINFKRPHHPAQLQIADGLGLCTPAKSKAKDSRSVFSQMIGLVAKLTLGNL
jgi:hypothetical protein